MVTVADVRRPDSGEVSSCAPERVQVSSLKAAARVCANAEDRRGEIEEKGDGVLSANAKASTLCRKGRCKEPAKESSRSTASKRDARRSDRSDTRGPLK